MKTNSLELLVGAIGILPYISFSCAFIQKCHWKYESFFPNPNLSSEKRVHIEVEVVVAGDREVSAIKVKGTNYLLAIPDMLVDAATFAAFVILFSEFDWFIVQE